MPAWRGTFQRPRLTMTFAIAVAVYLLVVLAEPFMHHSAACHANTPTHCTACNLQITSPGIEDDGLLQRITQLPDAGRLLPEVLPHDCAPLVTRTNDRSPPLA